MNMFASTVKITKQRREKRVQKELQDRKTFIGMCAKSEEDKGINHLNVVKQTIPDRCVISKALRDILGDFELKQGAIVGTE